MDFAARGKFTLIIWRFELSELCRPAIDTSTVSIIFKAIWKDAFDTLFNYECQEVFRTR